MGIARRPRADGGKASTAEPQPVHRRLADAGESLVPVTGLATYATSAEGLFGAAHAQRGQSLIGAAMNEGRQCARVRDR